MDVEELEDDFFSFQPTKPAQPAGGFSNPRAGRRSSVAQGDPGAADGSANANALAPRGAMPGAAAGDASNAGGEEETVEGRAGRGRRNFMLGPQSNEDAATASSFAAPAQNKALLGRRASPRVDLGFQQQQQQQQPARSPSPTQAQAPALGAGDYVPSMGRRSRAAGGLLGLNAGGGGIFGSNSGRDANTNQVGVGIMNAHSNAIDIGNTDSHGYAPMMRKDDQRAQQPLHPQYAPGPANGMQDMWQQQQQQQAQYGQQQAAQQRQGGNEQQYQQYQAHSAAHQPVQQQQWGGEQAGQMVSLNNYAPQQQQQQQQQQHAEAGQGGGGGARASGGFKFKFGAKATPSVRLSTEDPRNQAPVQLTAAPGMGGHAGNGAEQGNQFGAWPQMQMAQQPSPLKHAAARGASDAKSLSPNMRAVGASHESGKEASHEGGKEASRISYDSTVSESSAAKVRKGGMQPGELKKNERLRKLEEELNGMAVTQELLHAYVDPSGRNRRPREMGEKGRGEKGDANSGGASRLDNGAPRLDNFRGGGDADVSRNELLKAYKQAETYRQENQRLKNQLDQCMNSFEEIVRLKNLVAEKVKVIAIMEKERTGMQKLHRQYQKERTDQDSMETEYGERMRRVNEDLRVAKGLILIHLPKCNKRVLAARCNKYKEIHVELEKQLAQEQTKARQEMDNNRQLKEKLRAIQALAPGASEDSPFDPSRYKQSLEDRDMHIKKLEHDVQVLKKAKDLAERQQAVKAKENKAGKDHYREQADELEAQLEIRTRELKENQVLVRKLQSQVRRMKLEITSLQKLNQDRIKLGAIMGEAPIETPEPDFDQDADEGSTFLTHLDPDLARKGDDACSQASSRASTAHKRPPVVPAANKKAAAAKVSQHKEDCGPGGPSAGEGRRHANTPPTGGGDSRRLVGGGGGNSKDRKQALARGKPETPADLASMISAQRAGPAPRMDLDDGNDGDDAQNFAPYGKPPPLKLGVGQSYVSSVPAYEKLLSPQARSVLEDARSWRSATQTQRTNNAASVAQEEEGGYEDDFESIPSSRLPSQPMSHNNKLAHAQAPQSPRLDSEVEDEVEEEDMDFLLAGLT